MVENYPGPLTVDEIVRKPGHFLTGQLARAILRPGEADATDAIARVRSYFQRGYLHPVGQDATDKRKPYLFTREAALMAAILDHVVDLHVRDVEFTNAIALTQHWFGGEETHPDFKSPLALIWARLAADPSRAPGFSLRVQWRRDHVTGKREVKARIVNPTLNLHGHVLTEFRPGWYPLADMILPLDPILPDLARRLAVMDRGL